MISDLGRPLVLASSSASRAAILRGAGLAFDVVPARIDETAVIEGLRAAGAEPRDIAAALAEAKTRKVAAVASPDALVVGADQVLVCEGRIFEKPCDRTEAAAHLRLLSGKTHELVSALCGAARGVVVWRHVATARLTMRSMDEAFISDYLDQAGPDVLTSVGCYQLEGLGVHIMSRIDGDYFGILGLPLLAVLDFLRTQGALRA